VFNAARLLGLSQAYVYEMIEAKKLAVTREGRRLWLSRAQVEGLRYQRSQDAWLKQYWRKK
jgi:excisionase family DNA binding protein